MLEIAGVLPLAQMNTSIGAPGSQPAVEVGGGGSASTSTGAGGAAGGGAATSGAGGGTALTTAPSGTQPAGGGGGGGGGLFGGLGGTFLPIILMFVLLYLFLFRGQRKDEKKRKEMIATLKKGDRVMTIGGMLASVVSVEGEEVVLKIDESANVKARYRKLSIQEVIDRDEKK